MTNSTKCFECGDNGHMAYDCPNKSYIQGTGSDWCGKCDQRTRLIALTEEQDRVQRCRDCHPAARELGAQFRHCGACRETVYAWDGSPCGEHAPVGVHREVLPLESAPMLPREPGELKGMNVASLAGELAALRELELEPRLPVTPEREAGLRAIALRQVAESRRARFVT